MAYDNPIPGYGTRNTITLRLWAGKPSDQRDMVNILLIFIIIHFKVRSIFHSQHLMQTLNERSGCSIL